MATVQFLHQLHRRATQAHSALERHQAAFYLWEFGLRTLACVSVMEYAHSKIRDPKLQRTLQNLARPSLGHWWELVRLIVPVLADTGDEGFRRVQSALPGKSRDNLWDVIKLDIALRKVLSPDEQPGSRQTVNLRELFDRMVRYRNSEWKGFLGVWAAVRSGRSTEPGSPPCGGKWRSSDCRIPANPNAANASPARFRHWAELIIRIL